MSEVNNLASGPHVAPADQRHRSSLNVTAGLPWIIITVMRRSADP